MSACTHLCYRFNSFLDRHLLSWLEEHQWTKVEIALTWLILALYCNHSGSVGPAWWSHLFSGSSYNNPCISWLRNLHLEATSDLEFIRFFLTFLQRPKCRGRLSIGNFSTTGNFAHLCAQIILKSCLGFTNPLKLRYLLFCLSSFVEHTYDMPMQVIFIAFMRCCQCF